MKGNIFLTNQGHVVVFPGPIVNKFDYDRYKANPNQKHSCIGQQIANDTKWKVKLIESEVDFGKQ